jgi:hypothetical protein
MKLTEIHTAYVAKHGEKKAAEVIGKNPTVVQRWAAGNMPTLMDAEKLALDDPSIFALPAAPAPATESSDDWESTPPAPYAWPEGKRVAILMPTNRAPVAGVLKCFATLFERDKMQFIPYETNFPPTRGRNWLAQRFLESSCEWSLWWDDDILVPHGDVAWFRNVTRNQNFPQAFANINPIAQLMSRNQTLIGGCYFGRAEPARAQFANAFTSALTDEAAHFGPRNHIEETPWIGFGFTLVHRSVFTDIIKTQPEVEMKDVNQINSLGYRYRFFNALSAYDNNSENSEDACFCHRAALAGHKTWVDHSVVPTHWGSCGYSFHNTRKTPPRLY